MLMNTGQRKVLLREARTLAANNWRRRAPSHPSPAATRQRGIRRLRLSGGERRVMGVGARGSAALP
jgi:hypothetical protein